MSKPFVLRTITWSYDCLQRIIISYLKHYDDDDNNINRQIYKKKDSNEY